MLLVSMSAIIHAKINILHHMGTSNQDEWDDLQFWPNSKSFDEVCKDVLVSDEVYKVLKYKGSPFQERVYFVVVYFHHAMARADESRAHYHCSTWFLILWVLTFANP